MSERYIYLKNGDELVKQEKCKGQAHKEQIIEKWKKLYGKKFEQLTIEEDAPEVKEKYTPKVNNKFYGSINFNRKRNTTNIRKDWGYKD